jgi:hypothetical protein
MKKKPSSELYASLSAASIDSNTSDFEVLSLRVSRATSAMIHALNVAFERPVLTMFTDRISQHLADSLLDSLGNEPLIVDEASKGLQPDSALDLLRVAGAIEYDDPRVRDRFRAIIQQTRK